MVFSSLLFLYAFLPLNLLFYALAKSTAARNVVLLMFSLVFYAWGEPVYVLLLIFMALADWLLALKIQHNRRRCWLVLACVINLGILAVFKYLNFAADTVCGLLKISSIIPSIALPIGISFYTFQLLSYVIDVYRGDVLAQPRFDRLLLYASLFHQCIAGPIVRYRDVETELTDRRVDWETVSEGIGRSTVGLGKKVLIANVCGDLADSLLEAASGEITLASVTAADGAALWVSMLAYMLQIYFDFSGYSDMAIGMGRMIGFHYPENFRYPYMARSIKDFWRRWHISLSQFFRDYVYIPLGGSRCSLPRTLLNMLVVWALTGLWHGAGWNFVLWGLWFFVFLAIEKLFLGRWLDKLPAIIGRVYALAVVYFGWILFRFRDMSIMWAVVKGLFGFTGNYWMTFETSTTLKNYVFFLPVAILCCTPFFSSISRLWNRAAGHSRVAAVTWSIGQIVLPIVLLALSTAMLVGDSYNPFLYLQF